MEWKVRSIGITMFTSKLIRKFYCCRPIFLQSSTVGMPIFFPSIKCSLMLWTKQGAVAEITRVSQKALDQDVLNSGQFLKQAEIVRIARGI